MSKFQGYAQENRGFNPIQVPDTSRRILEQAEETVRGLQAVRDADIANTAAYLNSFNEAMEQERDSFSENSRLMNLNAEVRKDNLQIQLEEAEARRKAAGQNREAIYKNLAQLSKVAAETYVGYQEQKFDNEYNEELTRLYSQDLSDRKDAEGYIADVFTDSNLFIQSTDVLGGAASAEAAGANPLDVAEMRQNTHGLSHAVKKARLDFASERWGVYLQQKFASDSETQVKLYNPDGGFIDGTPSQAVSSRDKAFVAQQLLTTFLKENGMYGLKPTMLVPALRKMRKGTDALVSSALQHELQLQTNEKVDALENSIFQSRVEPSAAKRWHKAFAGLQFLVPEGRRGARERLFKLMETPRQTVNGVPVGFSDDEITEIANSSLPDQPGKTLGERFRAEFLRINQNRSQRIYNRYTAEQRAEDMAIKKNHDQMLAQLIEDVSEGDNKIDLSDENLDLLQAEFTKQGPKFNEHIQTLERFRPFTESAVDEAPFLEQANEKIKYGLMTAEEAMKLPVSYETRVELAKKAKESNTISASKSQRNDAEDHIKAYLRDRAKDHGGKTTHRSLHVMSQYAVNRFSTDFITARRNGLTEQQAYDDALAKFNTEFDKDSAGMYAIDTNYAKDGFRSGVYKHFKEKEQKTSDYEATATNINQILSANPSAISTKLVDIDPLKKVAQQLGTGQKPSIIPQIQMIQRQARKPDGSSYSYAEVMMRQMEAHGLKPPKSIEAAIELENVIPPRYSFLRNYPSPTNTDVMIMSAGGDAAYTKAPQSHTNALVQAAQQLGVDPLDLATIIGFESAGSYSPSKMGGDGGVYRGLIQFSPDNQRRYGITPDMTFEEQLLGPVVQYFKDRFSGVGMSTQGASLLQLYTTVLAGNPKANINARDSFGTSSKSGVEKMQPHRNVALRRFFGGSVTNISQPQSFGDSPWQQSQNMNPKVVERLTPAN